MTCPHCERYKQSASMWRNKAYELSGTPLPWEPEELLRKEYERGFIDGMQKQMQSSVDKAVNRMAQRTWVGLTDEEIKIIKTSAPCNDTANCGEAITFGRAIEAKLKEKNT